MCTGRSLMPAVLPDLELHHRALLPAVAQVALARDPVRLPVVRPRRVEPEAGEVEEVGLDLVLAVALAGLLDHLLVADQAVAVEPRLLAHVDPDRPGALHLHLERGRRADRHRGARLRCERRDPVLGRGVRRRRGEEERGREGRGEDDPVHRRTVYGPGPLVRTAVVDIGTNSTRLLVADVERDGELRELVRESLVTRLGEGVEAGGRLRPAPRERVLEVVGRYASTIAEQGAERALAVMTSAVRDAADGPDFAAAVTARTGLPGAILGGDEEAELTFAGATAARSSDGLLVVDIGGGSTELVAAGFHVSMQVGVVRHGERHLHDDPPTAEQLDALAADVRDALAAAIDLELEAYDTRGMGGQALARATPRAVRDRLAALPLAARRQVTGLHP